MEGSILNNLGFDPVYIILAQAILTVLLIIIMIVYIVKTNRIYRRYDYFMRGKDAETLEDIIMDQMEDIQDLKSQDRANKDNLRTTNKNMRSSFQKFGMVKYNAFKGMGGNLSFAFAMLDYTNSGFVFNSVHSREGCYLYLKEVDRGQTETLLGNEEKEALERALGYSSGTILGKKE